MFKQAIKASILFIIAILYLSNYTLAQNLTPTKEDVLYAKYCYSSYNSLQNCDQMLLEEFKDVNINIKENKKRFFMAKFNCTKNEYDRIYKLTPTNEFKPSHDRLVATIYSHLAYLKELMIFTDKTNNVEELKNFSKNFQPIKQNYIMFVKEFMKIINNWDTPYKNEVLNKNF